MQVSNPMLGTYSMRSGAYNTAQTASRSLKHGHNAVSGRVVAFALVEFVDPCIGCIAQ